MTENTAKKTRFRSKNGQRLSRRLIQKAEIAFVKKVAPERINGHASLLKKKKALIEEREVSSADISRATRHRGATDTEILMYSRPAHVDLKPS